jgi:hypothetical protein
LLNKLLVPLIISGGLFSVNSVAVAAYGGQCVRYVKNNAPGGYNWDKYYPVLKNGKPIVTICSANAIKLGQCQYWIGAKDIWEYLGTASRGSAPKVGAAFIIGANSSSPVGHVAIVTKVSGDGKTFDVTHSNWEPAYKEQISVGKFTLDGSGKAYYTTSAGVKWKTGYPALGFIYKP